VQFKIFGWLHSDIMLHAQVIFGISLSPVAQNPVQFQNSTGCRMI